MSIESQFIPAKKEVLAELDISEELKNLNTDIESHFGEQIPNVDLETVLKSIFSPLHRVFIHTVDDLPDEAKSTGVILGQSSDFIVIGRAEGYEYQEGVSFEYKDSKGNEVPYDYTNPDLKIEQEGGVKTERVAFITNIYVTSETPLSSLPIILQTVESSFQQTYDEQGNEVVPNSLQKVLGKENIDDLGLSLGNTETLKEKYKEEIGRIHRILGSQKYQIIPTDSPEKKNLIQGIRKNLSKKAFFLFCMTRLVSGEDIYKEYTPQQLSQEYENYLQSLGPKNFGDDRNIHFDSREIQVHSGPFQNEAQEFLEIFDGETLNTNYLEAFIAGVKQFIGGLKITQEQKDAIVSQLLFPQIQNGESYNEYSARAILEIGKIVDIYFSNTEFEGEIGISEEALNIVLQDQIVDDTLDTFMNLSMKEQIREGDLFQVISENFSPKGIDRILREVYIGTPQEQDIYNDYLHWIGITNRFENLEDAKQQLSNVKEKLEKSNSKQEREKLEQDLQTLQYDIAMLVGLIIYSNEFYRYHGELSRDMEFTGDFQFNKRINMCLGQGGQVHQVLKGIFGMQTQATWFSINKEDYSHFVTLIGKNKNMRTDGHSAFNPEQNIYIERNKENYGDAVFGDTTSVFLTSRYSIQSQHQNTSLQLSSMYGVKSQLGADPFVLRNMGFYSNKLGDINVGLTYLKNATKLIQETSPFLSSISTFDQTIIGLLNTGNINDIPEYLDSMNTYLDGKIETDTSVISKRHMESGIISYINLLSLWTLLFYVPENFSSEEERGEYLSDNKKRVTDMLDLLVSKGYGEQVRKGVESLLSHKALLSYGTARNQEITRNLLIPYLKLY